MTYFLYQGSNLKFEEEILLKKVSIGERKSEDFCDIRNTKVKKTHRIPFCHHIMCFYTNDVVSALEVKLKLKT